MHQVQTRVFYQLIPSEFSWIAFDQDGALFAYRNEPHLIDGLQMWSDGGSVSPLLIGRALEDVSKTWEETKTSIVKGK
jgi:hypothetical protein